eukprot:COSAG05_NODE_4065_length_1689_cov_2.274843_2_plen_47_part_00
MELIAVRHGQLEGEVVHEASTHILCPSRLPWDDHTDTAAAVAQVRA